jgi:hypothetical protein
MTTGGKGGRPKKSDGDQATRHVRLFEDLAEWVSWIVRVEGGSSAQILDPLLRAPLYARFKKHEKVIEAIKAAERLAADSVKKKPGG